MERYCVAAFGSSMGAIGAEKRLRELLPVQLMPTPRCISASCGISLRFPPEQEALVRAELGELPGGWAIYLMEDGEATPL